MKFNKLRNPMSTVTTVENVPLPVAIVLAVIPPLVGALASFGAKSALEHALNTNEVSFDYANRNKDDSDN